MESSPIRRFQAYARQAMDEGIQVLSANIGQPDFQTPSAFFSGMREYLDDPSRSKTVAYGPSEGFDPFRTAFARFLQRSGILVDPCHVLTVSGASEALLFILMAICDPGDAVIIPEPFYTNYRTFCRMAGVDIIPAPTTWETGFSLPRPELFMKLATPGTRAIVICSPNNPTGAVYTPKQIEELLEVCAKKDLWLVADEVYREFVYESAPMSILHYPEGARRGIVIDSLSKRYSACGTRIGAVVCKDTRLLAEIVKMSQARLCPPTPEQIAAIPMLERCDGEIAVMRNSYAHRLDVLCAALGTLPGVSCKKPGGAFYVMARLPVDDAGKFAEYMVSKVRVNGKTLLVTPAAGFYSTPGCGKNEIRMAAVMEESLLLECVGILGAALEAYPGRTLLHRL